MMTTEHTTDNTRLRKSGRNMMVVCQVSNKRNRTCGIVCHVLRMLKKIFKFFKKVLDII